MMETKKYEMTISPRILELLGPNLYTNIYYVLAELIANAYDAEAHNVYVIDNEDNITIEDDGHGMSYANGDITKFLNVAAVSRSTEEDSYTPDLRRKKMGRKGIGKLAALSVSESVKIKTIRDGEKSGFIMSRHSDKELQPLFDDEITFRYIHQNGTAIVMEQPQYHLHKTLSVIQKNLVKIFPLVSEDFQIHIIRGKEEVILSQTDQTYANQLCAIITLGQQYDSLAALVRKGSKNIVECRSSSIEPITLQNNNGEEQNYSLTIEGWIGTYESVKGRKLDVLDFPDNFISLYANRKMGEFNILPRVGQNKLQEVYVVGQLHVDLFEKSDLPDMALSNRQGYKTDDPRYELTIKVVKSLLHDILEMRKKWADAKAKVKEETEWNRKAEDESKFRQAVTDFKKNTSGKIAQQVSSLNYSLSQTKMEQIVMEAIEENVSTLGIKKRVDDQKKKILISHTKADCVLADVVCKMLEFNNVPLEDIIYTNSENQECRIPEGKHIYDYLKHFFVDSYSDKKMYVLFITSERSAQSWGTLVEVGAAWITSIDNKIFNIPPCRPEHPLDDEAQWHNTYRDDKTQTLSMDKVNLDIFCQKIEDVCDKLGYAKKNRQENKEMLSSLVEVTNR